MRIRRRERYWDLTIEGLKMEFLDFIHERPKPQKVFRIFINHPVFYKISQMYLPFQARKAKFLVSLHKNVTQCMSIKYEKHTTYYVFCTIHIVILKQVKIWLKHSSCCCCCCGFGICFAENVSLHFRVIKISLALQCSLTFNQSQHNSIVSWHFFVFGSICDMNFFSFAA